MAKVKIFADGACSGNPGPGGWATILQATVNGELKQKEFSGFQAQATNNQMELRAVIEGFKALKVTDIEVEVITDSQYVTNPFNKGWIEGWVLTDFKKKANPELWKELLAAIKSYTVTWTWIQGHAGHPENERCDKLAVAEYTRRK